MYTPKEIQALRKELALAMRSDDIVATLESPATSLENEPSLIHCAAREGVLVERFLSNMLSVLYRDKNREHFYKIVEDDSLGFETLRVWWRISSYLRDNEPTLTLDYIINAYKKSDPYSITRIKWFNPIFTQSYNEQNWEFLLNWLKVATDAEIQTIHNRSLYGAMIGLMKDSHFEEAKEIMARKSSRMSELDRLFFLVPNYYLGNVGMVPNQSELIKQLHKALPDRGVEWDWLCQNFLENIKAIDKNYLDIRVDNQKKGELRQIILDALRHKKPLSLQRMGDGEVYHRPLPKIADVNDEQIHKDNLAREQAWWSCNIEESRGKHFADIVHKAVCNADILGIISAYRLIRDASPQPMLDSITGRALLAHVEALATRIPLNNKIITEDRCHTILYTADFLTELINAAESLVIVGGLSPKDMNLPDSSNTTFIALIPEQNKGLPTHIGARSLVEDFDDIAKDVAGACKPGTLALISGGYVGKALVDVAKRSGAVALDIGSLADLLAGQHTRSPGDAILH